MKMGIPHSDYIPEMRESISFTWQFACNLELSNMMREITEYIRPWVYSSISHRRETALCRLRIGHAWFSYSYLIRVKTVTQPLYESRMNWVHDPAPPASRRPMENIDDAPTAAITSASPGAPYPQKQPKKFRRRRRKNHRSANQNSAHHSTAPVTPDERWANRNLASLSATRPKSAANDLPGKMSTPVYHHQSFQSSHLPQPPIPAANENSAFQFGLERGGIPGPYKPTQPDPRQDLTVTHSRDNISGFSLSSPSLLQPCTTPFSGLPSRRSKTSPT